MKKLFLAAFAAIVSLCANAQLTNGTVYWIQDVATGQFISQGDSWATKAVTQDVGGLGFEAVYVSDGVYKLNNIMWNTVKNATVGLGVDLYVDQAPAEFTVTASGDGYTIKNGNNYLVNNGAENAYKEKPIGKTTDASAATVWKFLTKTEYDAAIQAYKDAKAASYATSLGYDVNSVAALEALIADEKNQFISKDYTSSITNPTLGSNDSGWTHGRLGNRGNDAGGWAVGSGCAEFWNGCGYAKQTVSNLPNGLYKVTFVGSYRPANSGEANNLISEKASSPAFVYANDAKVEFLHWIDVPAKANGRSGITVANGYQNSFYTYVTDGSLALGVVADGWTDGYSWCTFGQFTLTQIYSIASYKKAYDEALDAATAAQTSLTGFSVYASQKATLDAAITENTLTGDDLSDVDKLGAASAALAAAANAVAKEKTACDQYASIVSTIGEGSNVNLTNFVANASFEAGNLSSWTSTDGGGVADNNNFSGKVGGYYVERWSWAGTSQVTLSNGTLIHDAIVLPAGLYQISATGQVQEQYNGKTGGGYYLCGNNERVEIGAPARYSTYVKLDEDKSELIIKFQLDACTGNWISCDDVQLTYIGEDFPAYTLVTGKMNATISEAQSAAETAYQASKTASNYNSLVSAIAAAQASKDAYAIAGPAIAAANALKDAQNFASATAITTFADAIAALETPYEANTLATNEAAAAGTTLGSVVTGWHAAAGSAAVAYLNDGFSLNAFDAALYINTWSTEGETDGSNFKVPFYEYFAGDGSKLPENTWTGTLTGLENGLYRVSAWVRVRSMNGETAVTDLTGITMDVNGGTAIDVTEGNQIGESRFQLKVYTAEGLVKNGTLNVNFNIASDNNIHWLSFKNINYTKVRDLTPEEAAVVPADLAIDATKTVFIDKTVTLTPTSTTDKASIDGFTTWESDKTDVATVDANGVVTAKAYGTANITVTSTLNGSATATCVVTVTAPTYDQLVNLDFAEGPVVSNHIRTYAKDKTGTDVAQMQEVTGWTMAVANGDAKAAGVMAYGSSYGMGSADFNAPATNPNGEATGNVFGMVGVWTGSVQYIQKMKLPAGAYTITVPVYRNGGGTALSKNLIGVILDDNTEYLASTKTYDSDKWTTETIKFTITSDTFGKLSIGLNSQNVGSGSSQRLWIDGITIKYEPFATSSEIETLNTAIETAENNHPLGFEDGQYAPYNNVAALKVVAAAKALNTTDPIAQSEVTGATTAVESATWNANDGDVDAIYNGMFATVAEGQNYPDGWKRTNGWGQMRSDISGDYATAYYNQPGSLQYGNQGVYTMPLAGNQAYKLTFSYRSHENNSNNGVTVSVKNGDDGLNDVVFSKNGSTSNWKTVEAYFTTGAAGNYVLTLANNGNTWMTNVSLVKVTSAAIEISENASFTPAEKYANITLDRTIKADTWNSFVVPFDITNDELKAAFGDEVAVAEFSENSADENDVQVAFNSMTTPAITANKPVLLKGNAGTSFEFSGKLIKTGEAKVVGTNVDFVGAYAASTDVAAGNYFISGNKLWKSAGNTTLKGTRAYIDAKNVSNVRMFIDDMETSISEIDNDSMRNGEIIYNMAGQRVSKAQKGLYIVNGRKVIVK